MTSVKKPPSPEVLKKFAKLTPRDRAAAIKLARAKLDEKYPSRVNLPGNPDFSKVANETEPAFKTEKELRDWYSRAEAGTLYPPMTPEEARIMTDELIEAGRDIKRG
jgi:hypothetical protein